ncbi:MAG: helix-turn-helix domain-containing protein [Clostridia bacterium]|nr:helix-turn-helix domain-containing protein [Clostridia bacterium]
MKVFFARGRAGYDPEEGKSQWLYINNLGYYRDIKEDVAVTRPSGRKDYHLLYVSNGKMIINRTELSSGEVYMFYPDEPQSYIYKHRENSLYYWIHFTGSRLPELLAERGLCSGTHTGNGRKNEIDGLCLMMSDAAAHAGEVGGSYGAALLLALFELISSPPPRSYPFSRARQALEDLSSDMSVNGLAVTYGMSPAHFIRSFKRAYGTTPQSYRISCQLTYAKNLLFDTELSICAVAEQCGFSDAFYFSRLFKKHMGVTPTEYRKQTRE